MTRAKRCHVKGCLNRPMMSTPDGAIALACTKHWPKDSVNNQLQVNRGDNWATYVLARAWDDGTDLNNGDHITVEKASEYLREEGWASAQGGNKR